MAVDWQEEAAWAAGLARTATAIPLFPYRTTDEARAAGLLVGTANAVALPRNRLSAETVGLEAEGAVE